MISQEYVTETWTYAGVRVGDKTTKVYAWLDAAGKELWYSKVGAHFAVGSLYQVKVSRDQARTTIHGVPEYTGQRAEDALCQELWAKHTVALTRLQMIRSERSDAKHNAVDDALRPLLRLAATLRTSAERDALTAYVIRQINSTWTR